VGSARGPLGIDRVGRNSSGAAARLRVRVQSNRLVIGEAIAAAIREVAGQSVIADTTHPTQAHRASRRPDVVVVVGSRGDGSTSAAVRTARRRWRQSFVIALAETDRVEDGVALARQGADIWLVPDEGIDALRSVLARIASGERVLPPPAALAYIASSLSQPSGGRMEADARLTSRESQVLECFAQGLSRTDIAALLGISRATLRTHVQNILRKLGLHSMDVAAAQAFRGALEPSPADAPGAGSVEAPRPTPPRPT
jgi:DNA-binding NarL/FixJ family response regulator